MRPASNATARVWGKKRHRCRPCVCAAPNSKSCGPQTLPKSAGSESNSAVWKLRPSDTLVVRDTLRLFRWRDAWVRVEGAVTADSVLCRVESADTLRQVVHRIPRRFLFIRWGTKALRQEIVPSNPHTRIVYSEYVKIER